MDVETVKRFLLSCHAAAHITRLFPELPDGLGPRDIRVIETIHTLADQGRQHDGATADAPLGVRVSAVSDRMAVTRPGVTRAIGNLETLGYVEKTPGSADGRTVLVRLTEQGERAYEVFARDYHLHLAEVFAELDEADLAVATRTIERARDLMLADLADRTEVPEC